LKGWEGVWRLIPKRVLEKGLWVSLESVPNCPGQSQNLTPYPECRMAHTRDDSDYAIFRKLCKLELMLTLYIMNIRGFDWCSLPKTNSTPMTKYGTSIFRKNQISGELNEIVSFVC
jgi:hypothetical protein